MSARLSSAQLVCSSCSPPPQHFPTVPLLSRCLTYGGVLKGDRQRSPDTPHLVATNTSAPAEKHMRTFLEPITPVFFVVFFCSSSFLAPVEMRRWKQLFLPLQLLAGAWRTLQSQLYNFPTRITTCVSVNGATQGSASDRFATPLHVATRGRRGSH